MRPRYTSLGVTAVVLGVVLSFAVSKLSLADEGGNSMCLPGSYGSLAAVPGEPGWTLGLTYYHATGAVNNAVVGHATENSDLGYSSLTYAFKTPVVGGQLALSMVGAIGGLKATAGTIE